MGWSIEGVHRVAMEGIQEVVHGLVVSVINCPPGMSDLSFKVQKCPVFKVLNLKKEHFKCLILRYFSCYLDSNLR